jgi:hypothetical protein
MLWADGGYRFTFTDESDTKDPKALERRLYLPDSAVELDSIWSSLEPLLVNLPDDAECLVFKPRPHDGLAFGFAGDPDRERYASFVAEMSGDAEVEFSGDENEVDWLVLADTVVEHYGPGARLDAQWRAEGLRERWLEEAALSNAARL